MTPHMSGTLMAGFPGSERPRQNVPRCGLIAGLRKQAEPITQRSLLSFGRCDVSVTDSRKVQLSFLFTQPISGPYVESLTWGRSFSQFVSAQQALRLFTKHVTLNVVDPV